MNIRSLSRSCGITVVGNHFDLFLTVTPRWSQEGNNQSENQFFINSFMLYQQHQWMGSI